jgi:dihydropyrimidine dehydrogenase (NAD+) subunit PreA
VDELDRDSVVYPVFDQDKCIGCGRCAISCRDGGHSAIDFDKMPKLIGKKCVGCHLCCLVCPVHGISVSKRVAKLRENL